MPWFVVGVCTLLQSNRVASLFTPFDSAENSSVKHIHISLPPTDDIPIAPFLMDRRRTPDRRSRWRGGRRDTDWVNRPPDAWARVIDDARPTALWRQMLASLHIW
jgi:hypothetical protein